jgi:hypothetical protein
MTAPLSDPAKEARPTRAAAGAGLAAANTPFFPGFLPALDFCRERLIITLVA